MALDEPPPPPARRTTEVISRDSDAGIALPHPPPAVLPQPHVAPPESSGMRPSPHAGTLVMEPSPLSPKVAEAPRAAPTFGAAPKFGAPPPAPKPASVSPAMAPLNKFASTAIVDNDEIQKARARLSLGGDKGLALGARISADPEPPTSTRAPFRIDRPKPQSERQSTLPVAPPWLESTPAPKPMSHPLERTQEAAPTGPMAQLRQGPPPPEPPPPVVPQFAGPAPKPLDADATLASAVAAPKPPPNWAKDEAFRPPGTPTFSPPTDKTNDAPALNEAAPERPVGSPYGRDLPRDEHQDQRSAFTAPQAETPKAPERKTVGGLYGRFGKK